MNTDTSRERIESALRCLFVGDSLAMPVHWYYNPGDIYKQFPGGIYKLEDAPAFHPSSIMSLHSTRQGGRSYLSKKKATEIVGDVILKGKRQFWGVQNQHYHQGMKAGENTLNAHCVRVAMRSLSLNQGAYSKEIFLKNYIALLTADKPEHPDTYAESYHRGFFANLEQGVPPEKCGATTHDTASVGGLVMLAPIVFSGFLHGLPIDDIKAQCHEHLFLTHPDDYLTKIAGDYVELLIRLLGRDESEDAQEIIANAALKSIKLNLKELSAKNYSDFEIVGGIFTSACYITGSWPSVLYFAYKYCGDVEQALIANTNVGGDNAHRGSVLGVILGLVSNRNAQDWFNSLTETENINREITTLIAD
ncbi:MAG TPA: ADP-ribosylglycohydrolase family protein [Gammaproteobacteria bacterium]|nr:ADP-ribosylglycohydrolase family protein [Gammaproteobacteria bacterium]